MRILLTGAFGNIGLYTARALLERGFHVTTFDLPTPRAKSLAAGLTATGRAEVAWGDLRDASVARRAVLAARPDVVVHLAAVIPPPAYFDSALARSVNVDGTESLLAAASASPRPPRFVFASSYTVHGPRNASRELGPLTAATALAPADAYAGHKVEGELLVRRSGLPWVVLRLGACLPLRLPGADLRTLRLLFELPRRGRTHAIDQRDVSTAFANAVDADALGRVLFIGGDGTWRVHQADLLTGYQRALGLAPFLDEAFAVADPAVDAAWYFEDWMDTGPSEALLRYQRHSLADFFAAVAHGNAVKARLLRPLGPTARSVLCRWSPYAGRPASLQATPIQDRFAAIFGDAARPQAPSLAAAKALNEELGR